jgi:hypothetical protein
MSNIHQLINEWNRHEQNESFHFLFEKPCGYQHLILIPKYYNLEQMYHRVLNNMTGLKEFPLNKINLRFVKALDHFNYCVNSSSHIFFSSSFVNQGGGAGGGEPEHKREEKEEIHYHNKKRDIFQMDCNENLKETCSCGKSHVQMQDDVFLSEIFWHANGQMKIHDFIKTHEFISVLDVNVYPFPVYRIYYDYVIDKN